MFTYQLNLVLMGMMTLGGQMVFLAGCPRGPLFRNFAQFFFFHISLTILSFQKEKHHPSGKNGKPTFFLLPCRLKRDAIFVHPMISRQPSITSSVSSTASKRTVGKKKKQKKRRDMAHRDERSGSVGSVASSAGVCKGGCCTDVYRGGLVLTVACFHGKENQEKEFFLFSPFFC